MQSDCRVQTTKGLTLAAKEPRSPKLQIVFPQAFQNGIQQTCGNDFSISAPF